LGTAEKTNQINQIYIRNMPVKNKLRIGKTDLKTGM
jgi:hypothetical protein